MRKRPAFACISLALSLLSGCGTEPSKSGGKLEFTASPVPDPFLVGDTSGLWSASRTVILATGRADKTSDYPYFHLVSSDTDVVGVANGRFLVGRKAGSAQITAEDDRSDLVSESSVKVTVSAP